jgi:GTP cyclohydrolase I
MSEDKECGCGCAAEPDAARAAQHKANNAAHVRQAAQQAGERAIKTLLICIGEDPERPGLAETPTRVMKAWRDAWGAGYHSDPKELIKLFETERKLREGRRAPMVALRDIAFFSTCEHHMAPFFGTADICYIPQARYAPEDAAEIARMQNTRAFPNIPEAHYSEFTAAQARGDVLPQPSARVIGLSKLARIVEHFASRLQVQERLTQDIAAFLAEHLSGDVAVRIKARHMCMMSRGVRQHEAETITQALEGAFYDEPDTRREMIAHLEAR